VRDALIGVGRRHRADQIIGAVPGKPVDQRAFSVPDQVLVVNPVFFRERDPEAQQVRRVPDLDGLDERAGGEFAISSGAGTRSFDPRSFRISQPGTKVPLVGLRQF
jgi:hypothetical protein